MMLSYCTYTYILTHTHSHTPKEREGNKYSFHYHLTMDDNHQDDIHCNHFANFKFFWPIMSEVVAGTSSNEEKLQSFITNVISMTTKAIHPCSYMMTSDRMFASSYMLDKECSWKDKYYRETIGVSVRLDKHYPNLNMKLLKASQKYRQQQQNRSKSQRTHRTGKDEDDDGKVKKALSLTTEATTLSKAKKIITEKYGYRTSEFYLTKKRKQNDALLALQLGCYDPLICNKHKLYHFEPALTLRAPDTILQPPQFLLPIQLIDTFTRIYVGEQIIQWMFQRQSLFLKRMNRNLSPIEKFEETQWSFSTYEPFDNIDSASSILRLFAILHNVTTELSRNYDQKMFSKKFLSVSHFQTQLQQFVTTMNTLDAEVWNDLESNVFDATTTTTAITFWESPIRFLQNLRVNLGLQHCMILFLRKRIANFALFNENQISMQTMKHFGMMINSNVDCFNMHADLGKFKSHCQICEYAFEYVYHAIMMLYFTKEHAFGNEHSRFWRMEKVILNKTKNPTIVTKQSIQEPSHHITTLLKDHECLSTSVGITAYEPSINPTFSQFKQSYYSFQQHDENDESTFAQEQQQKAYFEFLNRYRYFMIVITDQSEVFKTHCTTFNLLLLTLSHHSLKRVRSEKIKCLYVNYSQFVRFHIVISENYHHQSGRFEMYNKIYTFVCPGVRTIQ